MAYDNVQFPFYPMLHGVRKEIIDPVVVSSNGTYEYRVKRSRWERFRFSLPTQTMEDSQKEAIRVFLSQRNHGLNSFRFVDPALPTFDDAILSHNTGAFWNIALPFDASTPGTHPIFNPVIGGLTVTVDGGGGTINSTSVLNGVPVIEVTGTTGGEVVRVSGPINFTVRLDSNFDSTIFALKCAGNLPLGHQVANIELIEVYNEV